MTTPSKPKMVKVKRIELSFIPPFYIMRLGSYINLWDEHGTPLKPVIVPEQRARKPKGITDLSIPQESA